MHKIVNGEKVLLTPEEIAEVEAEWAKNAEEQAKIQYSVDRKASYPSIGDQLDMLWHAMDDGLLPKDNDFYGAIKKIKEVHPKPQSN